MSIHTFGDSHSFFGWDSTVQKHWIGPVLCYSFGTQNLNRLNISNFNLKNGDTIIFCFGEIDCRCHINKHVSSNVTYNQIIDAIVYRYFDAIQKNLKNLNVTLKNVCVYNVVPPVKKCNIDENRDGLFLGTDEERKQYVLYFNKKIREYCELNNFIFFDIYNNYVDNDGYLNKELSDGIVHIKNGLYLSEFIKIHLQ